MKVTLPVLSPLIGFYENISNYQNNSLSNKTLCWCYASQGCYVIQQFTFNILILCKSLLMHCVWWIIECWFLHISYDACINPLRNFFGIRIQFNDWFVFVVIFECCFYQLDIPGVCVTWYFAVFIYFIFFIVPKFVCRHYTRWKKGCRLFSL